MTGGNDASDVVDDNNGNDATGYDDNDKDGDNDATGNDLNDDSDGGGRGR